MASSSTKELTASGMMSLARVQQAPLSPTALEYPAEAQQHQHQHHSYAEQAHQHSQQQQHDQAFLQDFERAWTRFVQQKADLGELPKGRRERRMEALQHRVRALRAQRDREESELLKQLAFVQQQHEALSYVHETHMQQMEQHQAQFQGQWREWLAQEDLCRQLQNETLPWFHFVRQLDLQASLMASSSLKAAAAAGTNDHDTAHSSSGSTTTTHPTAMRPSARAMRLIQSTKMMPSDSSKNTSVMDKSKQLRAYRVDQALLNTHIDMLHKEIQRYQTMIPSQERAGHFLTQHNVWNLLSTHTQDNDVTEDEPDQPKLAVKSASSEYFDCQEEKKDDDEEENHDKKDEDKENAEAKKDA